MLLWRVSRFASLDGDGGLFSDGRWHRQGTRVVYLAEHSALALLEALVHLEQSEATPPSYALHRVEGPDDLAVSEWPKPIAPGGQSVSASWGQHWLDQRSTALARVPAVVAPHAWNWLLNPIHPDAARFRIVGSGTYPCDARLLR